MNVMHQKTDSSSIDTTGTTKPPADETQETSAQDSVQQMSLFNAVIPDDMNTETNNEISNPQALDPKTDSFAEPETSSAQSASESAPVVQDEGFVPLGQRLTAAREARGWKREEVASRLRLPVQIVQSLEKGDYQRTSYSIYLRGYLTSYTRLLDLPSILVENVLREHGQTPDLVTSNPVSKSRYLFDRYSVSALYLILTGVIIVPAVWLAMRTTFEPNLAQFTPLDTPLATTTHDVALPEQSTANPPAPAGNTAADTAAASKITPAESTSTATSPLIASMAPFPATPAEKPSGTPATTSNPDAHAVHLNLRDASWVEIVSADGQRLEYGLLQAGTDRTYSSDKALEVRLGNSAGATVEIDGKPIDLAPYRRSNVAHFKLFGPDQPVSRAD